MDPIYNYQYQGNVPPGAAGAMAAFFGGMFLLFLLLFVAIYVIMAISLMKIANRTNTPSLVCLDSDFKSCSYDSNRRAPDVVAGLLSGADNKHSWNCFGFRDLG